MLILDGDLTAPVGRLDARHVGIYGCSFRELPLCHTLILKPAIEQIRLNYTM
jgi:hypothetical protein